MPRRCARGRSRRATGRRGRSRRGSRDRSRAGGSRSRTGSRYHAHLVAGGLASSTVKKDRAALNTFLRWLAEHDHVPARQVRDALAVQLPRARGAEQRETPKALSAGQYDRLIREAKARMTDDALAGARDLASCSSSATAGCAAKSSHSCSAATSCQRAKGRSCARSTCATAKAIAAAAWSSAPRRPRRSCAGTANDPRLRRASRRRPAVHHPRPPSRRRHVHPRRRPLRPGRPRRGAQASGHRRRAARGAAPSARARATCATELLRTYGVTVATCGCSSGTRQSRRHRFTSPPTRTARSRPYSRRERGWPALDDDRDAA